AKLNRDVAIKVLPEALARDPASLSRFEREAQAVAALSHPNILAIYDFGSAQGATYAVSELLEGDTLRARLAGGALPIRKAIDYGVHIVRGVAAAHERGIVHRDLKPENIFITKDGVVKILDFGLAKTAHTPAAPAETQLAADTTPGTVLGTVGYMSPEQVRGLAVDHRTDIFSFGAILYEMLTGRRAFRGDSHVETMNAILKEDPPEFAEINSALPSSLDRIIRRCLEKSPADRFHSAHDLAIALEAMSGASSQSAASIAPVAVPSSSRWRLPLLAGAALLVVGLGAFFAGRATSAAPEGSAPEFQRLTYRRGPVFSAKLAPDGTTIVFSAAWDGNPTQLFSTRAESPESLLLPYANADVVAISSKGELAIVSRRRNLRAYARPGTLARAPISSGASRDVLEDVQDADWLPDASNLVVTHVVNGRYRLEFPIGTSVYETGGWISHPRVSPDGRHVAFLDHPIMGDDRGSVAVIDASGTKKTLSPDYESTQGLAWLPSGREVWYTGALKGSGRSLYAATLDAHVRPVLRVPATLTIGDIASDGTVLLAHDNGRRGIVGRAPDETKERDLSWLDWSQPNAISDDGRTLLITEEGDGGGPGYAIYLRKTDGSPAVRLGAGEAMDLSPDGKWVLAQRLNPAPAQLFLMPTGAGDTRAVTNDDITHLAALFTPDGKQFVFAGFQPNKPPRTFIQSLSGGAPRPVTPEGVTGLLMAPGGTKVMARDSDGQRKLFPIDGGAPEPVRGLEPADGVIRFTADGRGLLVRRLIADGVAQISRVDLATGSRTPVRQIAPLRESLGNGGIGQILLTPDAGAYVYGYGVTLSDLYLVKGLR
ncbi:MAG TPA: protein kinase, partial [Vicinamibacterales bacterium]|nr:protein kinase [Vicinamibacterales bacterium]